MSTRKDPQPSLTSLIEATLNVNKPKTIRDMARIISSATQLDEPEFVETINAMRKSGTIVLKEPTYQIETVFDYLFSVTVSGWFWLTVILTALAVTLALMIPEVSPLSPVRWVFGTFFVIYLPGYSLMKLLFPKASEMSSFERFALSIGLSLAIIPLIGLLLNFTPFGIRLVPVIASLASFTVALAVCAAVRQFPGLLRPSRE